MSDIVKIYPSQNLQYDLMKIVSSHACTCASCTTAQVIQVKMTVKRSIIPKAPPKIEIETCLLVKVSVRGKPDLYYGPTPLGYEKQLEELAKFCLDNPLPLYWKVTV